jgi:hypothetical protein
MFRTYPSLPLPPSQLEFTNLKLLPTWESLTWLEGIFLINSRLIYSTFYKKKGGALNPGRIVGVIVSYIGLLGAIGVFGVNFWQNYLKK